MKANAGVLSGSSVYDAQYIYVQATQTPAQLSAQP